MKRTVPFVNPLAIPSSPNPVRTIPTEEILERRGELSMWFKMQPCPCPADKRYPDCNLCMDGYIRTFQRTYPIIQESVYKLEENRIYTRYSPISSVQNVQIFGAGDGTGTQNIGNLSVMDFGDDWIDVTERLEYWKSVILDYEVSMYEDTTFEMEATGEHRVYLKGQKSYIVGVEPVVANINPDGTIEPIRPAGFGFDSLVFDRPVFGKIRAKLSMYAPIFIGYRTYETHFGAENTKVFMEGGDVELVVPMGVKMGRGDIITLLTSTTRTSQYIPFRSGDIDPLPYSPIAKISECYSRTDTEIIRHEEGKDFIIVSDYQIKWLDNKKPQSGFSIQYEYHPSFRVIGSGQNGSPENRKRPLIYSAKSISSWRARS